MKLINKKFYRFLVDYGQHFFECIIMDIYWREISAYLQGLLIKIKGDLKPFGE